MPVPRGRGLGVIRWTVYEPADPLVTVIEPPAELCWYSGGAIVPVTHAQARPRAGWADALPARVKRTKNAANNRRMG